LEIACYSRKYPGEEVNGDGFVHVKGENDDLVAVIDGLGHGPGAHTASQQAIRIIRENAHLDLLSLLSAVHKGLQGTRGAVAALARFIKDHNRMEYAGLGNIDHHSTNPLIRPISHGGILGNNWRVPKLFRYEYKQGDLFVIFSDGVSSRFDIDEFKGMSCEEMVKAIVARHGKDHDDATVLAVKISG